MMALIWLEVNFVGNIMIQFKGSYKERNYGKMFYPLLIVATAVPKFDFIREQISKCEGDNIMRRILLTV